MSLVICALYIAQDEFATGLETLNADNKLARVYLKAKKTFHFLALGWELLGKREMSFEWMDYDINQDI